MEIKLETIRKGFGEGLLKAGEINPDVFALCADLTESTQMHLFKDKFPERFIEIGVAEQNLVTVASGISAMGKIPVVSSYAMFSPGRNWEQIRTTITYNDRKVVIVGSHAGISVGPDGGTHQALEDVALMQVLPNMTVISPCDYIEARKATIDAILHCKTPVYLRLFREKTPIITTEETHFEIGKITFIHKNCESNNYDLSIFANGPMLDFAIGASDELKDKYKIAVLNVSTIKPLDTKTILEYAKNSRAVMTCEEHQIAGGMGSAISQLLAQEYPIKMDFVGVNDRYGQSGTKEELYKEYGLDKDSIIAKIHNLLK